jgi:hypothetical protein
MFPHFRDETYGDDHRWEITFGDESDGDETYGEVMYREVSSLYLALEEAMALILLYYRLYITIFT